MVNCLSSFLRHSFSHRFLLVAVWTLLLRGQAKLGAGTGFCLDQVPTLLKGSGFTAPSTLTQAACTSAGHTWCVLNNGTDNYTSGSSWTLYYFFSTCCSGKQAKNLIIDSQAGLPTCASSMSASNCKRHHWADKLMENFVTGPSSGYNFEVAPGTSAMDPLVIGGFTPKCLCNTTDTNCKNVSADGKSCVLCITDARCSPDYVELGLHFFKIHSLDLKTSEFFFSGWIRQEWRDPRLAYDYQCYGGMEYYEVVAEPGSLENSRIWTPDIELYNSESPIWQGSISARMAQVYTCYGPNSGYCGYIFFSRPGIIRALCKFQGVLMFPYDILTCELEFAAFALDGRYQDIIPRIKDGGFSWVDSPTSKSMSGITAGSSFQDYVIQSISAVRYVTFYDCCPSAPWPEVIYSVTFKRSASYYVFWLVVPGMGLAVVGFLSFWMEPCIGERLGFCMVVILAIVTNDIVAREMMPVSDQRVLMDLISLHCKAFALYALLETGIVLYLYNLKCETWTEALVPAWVLTILETFSPAEVHDNIRKSVHSTSTAKSALSKKSRKTHKKVLETEAVIRKQLWLRAFYTIDEDFSGTLTSAELSDFVDLMLQSTAEATSQVVTLHDADGNNVLNEEEFLSLCEDQFVKGRTYEELERVVGGFLQSQDRKGAALVAMWQKRALNVDVFSRWTFPPGFGIAILSVSQLTQDDLQNFEATPWPWLWFFVSEHIPLFVSLFGIGIQMLREAIQEDSEFCCCCRRKDSQANAEDFIELRGDHPVDLKSINIDQMEWGHEIESSEHGIKSTRSADDKEGEWNDPVQVPPPKPGQTPVERGISPPKQFISSAETIGLTSSDTAELGDVASQLFQPPPVLHQRSSQETSDSHDVKKKPRKHRLKKHLGDQLAEQGEENNSHDTALQNSSSAGSQTTASER